MKNTNSNFISSSFGLSWLRASLNVAAFACASLLVITSLADAGGAQGVRVRRGNVSFSQDGNRLIVRASNGAIIEYDRLSVEAGQIMQFIQPGSRSRVLNRVTGSELTRIDGTLLSNGIVYLINPQGFRIGNGAVIKVGGFFAAAGAMSNSDFLSRRDRFSNLTGQVTNDGLIQAQAVALVGQYVANRGTIDVGNGYLAMGAGDSVVIQKGTGPVMVTVSRSQLGADGSGAGTQAAISNTGTINAGKGSVSMASGDFYALAMDLSGSIIGKSIAARGGKNGVVAVNGTLDASSSTGKGGTIDVFGDRVGLFGNALVNANGATGGGSVRIGGDYLGTNAANAPQANRTFIGTDARVTANATQGGDGGRVIVWSNEYTGFFGSIEASAVGSGKGGFIETSSKGNLQAFGQVDASSALGQAGTWLLDPSNVEITINTNSNPAAFVNPWIPDNDSSQVSAVDIVAVLDANTNVIIQTNNAGGTQSGNITMEAGASITSSGTATLTLIAAGNINITETITGTGAGALSVVLGAFGSVTVGAVIDTNGGNFTIQGADATGATLAASAGSAVLNANITTGVGDFSITATGAVNQTGGALVIGGTTNVTTGAAAITLTQAGNDFGGAVSLTNTGANNIAINDSTGLILGTVSMAAASAGTLTVTSVGLTQDGATTITTGTGAVTINAGAGVITLTNLNDFNGAVSLTNTGANAVAITDVNALILGVSTVGQNLSIIASALDIQAAITAVGVVNITSNAGVNVGLGTAAVGLDISNAEFLLITADSLNITAAGAGTMTVDGVTNGGAITGITTLTAGGTGVTFSGVSSSFDNALTVASPAILNVDVSTTDAAMTFAAITLGANVSLDTNAATAAGDITLGAVTGAGFGLNLSTGAGVAGADVNGTTVSGVGTLALSDIGGTATFTGAVSAVTLTVPATVVNVVSTGNGGTITNLVTFANTGTLTLGQAAGTQTYTGGLSTAGVGGLVTMNGTFLTTDAAITLGAITLGSTTTLDTNAATTAGDITLGAITSAGFDLNLSTGAGVAGADVTGTTVSGVGTLALSDIGGTATFTGAVSAVTLTVPATVVNVVSTGTGGTIASLVTFANTGDLTLGQAGGTQTYTGGLSTAGVGGLVTMNGTFNSTGDQTYGDLLLNSDLTHLSASGNIFYNGTINDLTPGQDTLTSTATLGNVQYDGLVGNTGLLGALIVTAGGTINLNSTTVETSSSGGGSGNQTYNSAVVLGNAVGSTLTSTVSGAITFASTLTDGAVARDLTLNAAGVVSFTGVDALGLIDINNLTITNAASATFAGNVQVNDLITTANPYTVTMTGATNTFVSNIDFNNTGAVTLGNLTADTFAFTDGLLFTGNAASNLAATVTSGALVDFGTGGVLGVTLLSSSTVDSTNLGGTPAGAGINFGGIITDGVGTFNLGLNAGTGGAIAATGVDALGLIDINNLTITNALSATFAGNVQVNDLITTANPYTVTMTGATNTFAQNIAYLNGGRVTMGDVAGTDTFLFNGGMNFTNNAASSIGGFIRSPGVLLDFGTGGVLGVTLLSNSTVDSTNVGGTPLGAAITFGGILNGTFDLDLLAGFSNITFTGVVGGLNALDIVTVVSALQVAAGNGAAQNEFNADTLTLTSVLQGATFTGALNLNTLSATGGVFNFTSTGTGGTIVDAVAFTNTGALTLGQAGGTQDFTNGLDTTGVIGLVTMNGTFTSGGDITQGNIMLGSDTIYNFDGIYTVGTVNGVNFDLTTKVADLFLTGNITNVGTFTIENFLAAGNITLMGAGGLSIQTQAEWNFIQPSVDFVVLGNTTTNVGAVTVDAAWINNSAVTVDFLQGGAGEFNVNGNVSGTGSLTVHGSGNSFNVNADLIQAFYNVTDSVVVLGGVGGVTRTLTATGALGIVIDSTGFANGISANLASTSLELLTTSAGAPITVTGTFTAVGGSGLTNLTMGGDGVNAGTITLVASGTILGALSADNASGISLNSNAGTLTAASMFFGENTTLTGTTTLVTTGTDIGFGTGGATATLNGAEILTLTSAGDILFSGAVGNLNRLSDVIVTSADTVLASSTFSAASFTQSGATATGATTFNGLIDLTTVFDFFGTALTINGLGDNVIGTNVFVENTGLFTLGVGANLVITNRFTQASAVVTGINLIGGNITTGDDIDFARQVTLNNAVVLTADTSITLTGNIFGVAQDLTMSAGTNILVGGNMGVLGGVLGDIIVTTANNSTYQGSINANSFTQLAGSGLTAFTGLTGLVNLTNQFDFTGEDLNINGVGTNFVGTTMDVDNAGLFTTANGANLTVGNDFDQIGDGLNSIGGNITSTNNGIAFATGVTLTNGAGVTMTTGLIAGDDIFFGDTLDGTAPGAQSITLVAGAGDITFTDAVGSGVVGSLGDILISSADDVDVGSSVVAASFTQTTGTGTTTFIGTQDYNGAAGGLGLNVTNQTIVVDDAVTSIAGGVTLNATTTTLTIDTAADILSSGSVSLTANIAIITGGDVTVTGAGAVNFNSATILTDDILVTNNVAGGGAITFASTLTDGAGPLDLTLDAGTAGAINFTGVNALGLVTINDLTLTNAASATFAGNVQVNDLITTANPYTVTMVGASNSFAVNTNFLNSGLVTMGDVAGTDSFLFNGGLNFDVLGNAPSQIGAIIRSPGQLIDFGTGGVTLIGNSIVDSTNSSGTPTGANIVFGGTLDGTFNLQLTAGSTGDIDFNDVVGGGLALNNVTVTSANNVNAGNGVAELAFNANTLNLATITTTATFTGALNLTGLNTNAASWALVNNFSSTGTLGTITNLVTFANNGFLTLGQDGGTQTFSSGINTVGVVGPVTMNGTFNSAAGDQNYGNITLGSDVTNVNAGGSINYNGTVNATSTGAQTLTSNASVDVLFDDLVGNLVELGSLTVTAVGTINLNSLSVATEVNAIAGTTGDQTYNSQVVLGNAVGSELTSTVGGDITFVSTIDAAALGTQTLTVDAAGDAIFGDNIGNGTALGELEVTAGGTIDLNSEIVNTEFNLIALTTGGQTYNSQVVLGNAVGSTLTSTVDGDIVFLSTIDADTTGLQTLTVDAAGSAGFGDNVGATGALGELTVTADDGINIGFLTPITIDTLASGFVTTGNQSYNSDVTVFQDAILTSSGGGDILFDESIEGAALGVNFTVSAADNAIFNGNIGAATALGSLDVTADTNGGVAAGNIQLNSLIVETEIAAGSAGSQDYNSQVVLGNLVGSTLTSTGGGDIVFASTIDAATLGTQTLTVDAAGDAIFDGNIGDGSVLGTFALGELEVTAGGTINLNSTIVDTEANGGAVTTGDQTYNSQVVLGNAVGSTLTSTGGGDITFNSTIDADGLVTQGLAVNAADNAIFGNNIGDDDIGGTDALGFLTVNAGNEIQLNSATVDTTSAGGATGTQTYDDAVVLGNTTVDGSTLTSNGVGNIVFNSTIDAAGTGLQYLIVQAAVNAVFGNNSDSGSIGFTNALGFLNVDAGNEIQLNSLTVDTDSLGALGMTGNQIYRAEVVLGNLNGGTTLTSNSTGLGSIYFESTIDADDIGEQYLVVSAADYVDFGDSVGSIKALGEIFVSAGTNVLSTDPTIYIGGAVMNTDSAAGLTGDQDYNSAVQLYNLSGGTNGGTTFTSASTGTGGIYFASTIDANGIGEQSLTVSAADYVDFGDSVGSLTALGEIFVTAGTNVLSTDPTIYIGGAVMNTNSAAVGLFGYQYYNSAVQLYNLSGGTNGGTTFTSASTGIGEINFASTIDANVTGAQSLTVSAADYVDFGDSVGSLTALGQIFVTAGTNVLSTDPTIYIGGAVMNTNSAAGLFGYQDYASAVLLYNLSGVTNGGTTFTSASTGIGGIYFASTIDANGIGEQSLTVSAADYVDFGDSVGSLTALGEIFVSAGTNVLSTDPNIYIDGAVMNTDSAAGLFGSQTYFSDTVLRTTVTMTATGVIGNAITFNGLLDGDTDETESLNLTAGPNGNIVFNGAVGSNVRLGEIVVINALDATFNSTVSALAFTQLAGFGTTTFEDLFDLTANFSFTGNNLTLNGFGDNVAGEGMAVDNLGLFTTEVGSNVVTTDGFEQFGLGSNSIGGDFTTVNNGILFSTDVTLTHDVTMTSTAPVPGGIGFLSTIDGAFNLVVNASTSGDVYFGADIGTVKALASLTVTSADFTTHFAGNVTTVGDQLYNGGAQMDADIVFTATDTDGDITFNGEVRSGTGVENMTVLALGNVTFNNTVGGTLATTQLGTFTVDCGNNFGETITFAALASTVRAVNVNLNTNTLLTTPATVATIVALDNISFANATFAMGQNEKLTSLGGIRINGLASLTSNATSVILGDVNAVGNLRVTSSSITLLARAAGSIYTNTGGTINDPMVDYVVGGQVFFSTAPVMGGSGGRATFSNPTGNVDGSGTLGNFAKTIYRIPITAALLTGQVGSDITGQILDLSAASGVSYTNPANLVPTPLSILPGIGLLGNSDTLDEAKDKKKAKAAKEGSTKKTASESNPEPTGIPVASR